MQTSESKEGPAPTRSTRSVRWLASGKLWIAAIVLIVLAIAISIVIPARQRLMDLRYLEQRGIEYELSSRNEWMTERFGDWAMAFRYVDRIKGWVASDEDLIRIARFHEVTELDCGLDWPSPPINDRSVVALGTLTNLEFLRLGGDRFSDYGIAQVLARHPPLRLVLLDGTGASRKTLMQMADSTTIEALRLNGTYPQDADFSGIGPPPNLEHLRLWGGERGDNAMKWAAGAPNLEFLQIAYNQVTDRGLSELAGSLRLESLHIVQCPNLTVDGLSCLESLPNLQDISLPGNLITPATLETLRRLPKLESVTVYGPIDDPDVQREVEAEWPAAN